ncbi:MAG: hypothetical protein CMN75_10370 [Spirochaeta sp.]|nr:hypothetical protein [Spirochaeta sp.]
MSLLQSKRVAQVALRNLYLSALFRHMRPVWMSEKREWFLFYRGRLAGRGSIGFARLGSDSITVLGQRYRL